jgi:hypothetical protein
MNHSSPSPPARRKQLGPRRALTGQERTWDRPHFSASASGEWRIDLQLWILIWGVCCGIHFLCRVQGKTELLAPRTLSDRFGLGCDCGAALTRCSGTIRPKNSWDGRERWAASIARFFFDIGGFDRNRRPNNRRSQLLDGTDTQASAKILSNASETCLHWSGCFGL